MSIKQPVNEGNHWMADDIAKLRQLARVNMPTRERMI